MGDMQHKHHWVRGCTPLGAERVDKIQIPTLALGPDLRTQSHPEGTLSLTSLYLQLECLRLQRDRQSWLVTDDILSPTSGIGIPKCHMHNWRIAAEPCNLLAKVVAMIDYCCRLCAPSEWSIKQRETSYRWTASLNESLL